MANLVQALILALAIPAAGQFSHRIHLAQKIECVTCHSKAPGSKAAADHLLPAANVCTSCHEDRKHTPRQMRALTVTKFNHALHARMGPAIAASVTKAIADGTYLGTKEQASLVRARHACMSCHMTLASDNVEQAYPPMADCLVCHNEIDPPYSCIKCHTESPALRPASHTPNFIDVHSAGKVKDKSGCASCHGRNFSCLGCH